MLTVDRWCVVLFNVRNLCISYTVIRLILNRFKVKFRRIIIIIIIIILVKEQQSLISIK